MTLQELDALRETSPARENLVDINTVRIDPELPAAERTARYIEQIGNPYHFKVGETAVHISFEAGGKPLLDHLKSYLTALRQSG